MAATSSATTAWEGIDQAAFEEAVRGAGEGCPISGALKGNVETWWHGFCGLHP
jgi:organic hydroperoxide reductase OsmC/OhrA